MSDAPILHPLRWGNAPVPYTAMWTTEMERRQPTVRKEEWCGRVFPMLCEGINAPEGKPQFKILHADRTRKVIRDGLCQMCLTKLPPKAVCFNQGQTDHWHPIISDGLPMCPKCASLAFAACPGLQRQARSGLLRTWLATRGDWLVAPVILGTVPSDRGGNERINDLLRKYRGKVFSGPKLVLESFRQISPDSLGELYA